MDVADRASFYLHRPVVLNVSKKRERGIRCIEKKMMYLSKAKSNQKVGQSVILARRGKKRTKH